MGNANVILLTLCLAVCSFNIEKGFAFVYLSAQRFTAFPFSSLLKLDLRLLLNLGPIKTNTPNCDLRCTSPHGVCL